MVAESRCFGSWGIPLSYALVEEYAYISTQGLCWGCGHFYPLTSYGVLYRHRGDGCVPNIYRAGCRRGQRPQKAGVHIEVLMEAATQAELLLPLPAVGTGRSLLRSLVQGDHVFALAPHTGKVHVVWKGFDSRFTMARCGMGARGRKRAVAWKETEPPDRELLCRSCVR